MCGIVGYIGCKPAALVGIKALKKLEYRGYDSAGIAIVCSGKLEIRKDAGRIESISNALKIEEMPGNIAILHTRWSTHGAPTGRNAHPHTDCSGDIAIVHNGIIENYQSFKSLLESEGHVIKSETDSEILAHLIEKFYSGNLEEAVVKALADVEGAYALAVVHKNEDKIVVAKKGSPLILGVGSGEMLLASDAAALLEHTKKVVYMNDSEVAVVTRNGFSVTNLQSVPVDKEVEEITWSLGQIEKKGFKHFMLKEIMEQPESLENTLRGRAKGMIKLSLNVKPKEVKKIIITACGTSWHSALIGKHIIEKIARVPVEVDYASEFRYRNPLIGKDTLVVAISQSGETADTLAAIKLAKSRKAKTLGIVNVVGSTIAREVDSGIYLHAGPEIGVASTKAFTSQIAALALLALFLKQEADGETEGEIIGELNRIPEKVRQVLEDTGGIEAIAKEFANSRNFLYLGRGLNFPVALEGALKLKEISYIHAEGYPAAEMKHGPIALIDENMPVVFIATRNGAYDKILSNMEEVRARGGKIIAVTTEGDPKIKRLAEHVIYVPKTMDILSPVINVIPLQLLAYHIADMKNIDVDKPRNLAKSVTVE
jgi:glucosamine--fructose-6-phosphate aminotransferase (isomerizing)